MLLHFSKFSNDPHWLQVCWRKKLKLFKIGRAFNNGMRICSQHKHNVLNSVDGCGCSNFGEKKEVQSL